VSKMIFEAPGPEAPRALGKPYDRKERRRARGVLHKTATNGFRAVRKVDRLWYAANRIRLVYGTVERYRAGAALGPLIHINVRTPHCREVC
jgi:hypothetical protein